MAVIRKSRSRIFWMVALCCLFLISQGCNENRDQKLFEKLSSDQTGIDFSNQLTNDEEFNIIDYLYYYNGGGVAIGDINNDGLQDIYFSANEGENKLYLNKGDLVFEDITESAGVISPGLWKTGVSFTDVNGDGWVDIYQCRLGNYKSIEGKNQLFINNKDNTFTESAAKYNLDYEGFSTHAAFFDADNDGDLDVYLLNHSVHTPRSYGKASLRDQVDSLAGDRFYVNEGTVFRDITPQSGIYSSQIGYGLGIGLTDINNDNYTDIFVSNDFNENDYFYINNGDLTFTESLSAMTHHTSRFSMGNDLADFNNDGRVDIMTLDMLPEDETIRKISAGDDPYEIFKLKLDFGYMLQYSRNTLQLNRGNGKFSDVAMLSGVHATDWSWASLFADFDNDGLKDLIISNGIARRPNDLDYVNFLYDDESKKEENESDQAIFAKMPEGTVANYFFKNQGDLTFSDQSDSWIDPYISITNGIAYSDLDNDGDLDLVLNNLNEEAAILKNSSRENKPANHYLTLALKSKNNNFGNATKVFAFQNGQCQFFEAYTYRGFQSNVDSRIHVGLGAQKLDSLHIIWPDGEMSKLEEIESDQILSIEQNSTNTVRQTQKNQPKFSFTNVAEDLGINYKHRENPFIEFNDEPLIPKGTSAQGPALAVGDVNDDGLEDFYIGGAREQGGKIYLQSDGKFEAIPNPQLDDDENYEDTDAEFFDYDQDGDLDLIVASGGNENTGTISDNSPRLYLNDGNGLFTELSDVFKGVFLTGSSIAIDDINQDGYPDLFLGAAVVPMTYGLVPRSFLLLNEEGKGWRNISQILPKFGEIGFVNDALWLDLNNDNQKELLVVGDWMAFTCLSLQQGSFKPLHTGVDSLLGWWNTIEPMDYDNDGDLDFVVGNLGLNSKLKVTKEAPVSLYVNDFDENGQLDPILTYHKNGKESIFPVKDDLVKQLPGIKKTYRDYTSFAAASVHEVFEEESFKKARKLQVNELRSGVFIRNDGKFDFIPLSNYQQMSTIQAVLKHDFDQDGLKDILTAGNFYASSVQEGRYNAGMGLCVLNQNNGQFELIDNEEIGLYLGGEVRKLKLIEVESEKMILVATNNQKVQLLRSTISKSLPN